MRKERIGDQENDKVRNIEEVNEETEGGRRGK
jgi:hypothetical protein